MLAQSYEDLDIVVIDDASPDNSFEIAEALAREDSRIRLMRNEVNRGIAYTLNRGIRSSDSPFIAPLDADDIWRPTKIARQVATLEAKGAEYGLVFCPLQRIDLKSRILYSGPVAPVDGWAYLPHITYNFIGTGSSIMMRRRAFEDVGGYNHDRSSEGADDLYIQLAIARRWKLVCEPSYLVGYRLTPGSVSSSALKDSRALLTVLDLIEKKYPETPQRALREKRAEAHMRIALYSIEAGRLRDALASLRTALSLSGSSFGFAFHNYLRAKKAQIVTWWAGGAAARSGGASFYDCAIHPDAIKPINSSIAERFARAMAEERAFRE